MEKISLLVDTDVFIDFLNEGQFSEILENKLIRVHYLVVTEKELLSKKNLKSTEKEAVLFTLKNFRRLKLTEAIAIKYAELRKMYPLIDKEDAVIASTALIRKIPIMTRNDKQLEKIKDLTLFTGK